ILSYVLFFLYKHTNPANPKFPDPTPGGSGSSQPSLTIKSGNILRFSAVSIWWYVVSVRLCIPSSRRVRMKRVLALLVSLAFMPVAPPLAQEAQKPELAKISLKVGDVAPDFTLLSDQWKNVKLSDFHGKQNVFLAVYVLAFTGG
ncbi:MAG: hypothetical protein WBE73_02750, partial [Candidatus Acidiferrum sp.]